MKLLVVSDIHGSKSAVNLISERISLLNPNVTIVCGDITNFGSPMEAKEIIDSIPGVVLAVPGNCDPPGIEEGVAESHGIDLHGKVVNIGGIRFGGFGGSKRMFGTVREYDEDYLGINVRSVIQGLEVLVLHGPPYGINDLSPKGHAGSREVLKAIRKHIPKLVLSGHIHECPGIIREGGITFINPGASRDGRSAYLEIDEVERVVNEASVKLMNHPQMSLWVSSSVPADRSAPLHPSQTSLLQDNAGICFPSPP